MTKIILRVEVRGRESKREIDDRLSEEQFGLKEDSGCRNAVFILMSEDVERKTTNY